jgi:hypothetical protein
LILHCAVIWTIWPDSLRVLRHQWKTEPGEFEITVGGSSQGGVSGKFTLP